MIGLDAPHVAHQDNQLGVCLQWRALSRVKQRYTTFVHVLGSGLEPAPQADVQPPYPTDLWAKGETVEQCMTLAVAGLPDQGWFLAIGMYDSTTLQRLPVRQRGGDLLPDNAITVVP